MANSVFDPTPPGRAGAVDVGEVRRALGVLADPGAGVHVQGIPSGRSIVVAGNNPDGLIDAARELDGGRHVYLTVNPVPVGLRKAPRVPEIIRRRWLMVDVDARRPDDANASQDEHDAARALASEVRAWLLEEWRAEPAIIDSGNGWHLLYRVDLPNDSLSRVVVKSCLRAIGRHVGDDPRGLIDTGVFPATIKTKLPGTWVRRHEETAGRPHRLARLVFAPEPVRPVAVAAVMKLAGVSETAAPAKTRPRGPDPFRLRPAGGRVAAYLKAALDRECAKVAAARPRERETTLTLAAFTLGQLVPAGLDRQEAETRLFDAACACGLDKDEQVGERGIRERINRRLNAGATEAPREVPSRNGTPVADEPNPPAADTALTVCAAGIEPQQVEWWWPGRVPKRFITVLAGRTGLGKSFVMIDMIARMTQGGEVPFCSGECFVKGGALIVSEDPPEFMLVPRLIEAGADLNKIRFMTWEAMAYYSIADVSYLDRACREVEDCRIVLIDPPTNFLGGTDAHKDAEVRQMLMRLVIWVKDRDLACVLIMHVNKQTGKGIEAVNRVMGSVAWVSTSRIAHSFTPDPEDPKRNLFVPMKNNLGPLPPGLAYEIVPANDLARVQWIGEVDTTADEAMNNQPGRPRRVVAADWLKERFREKLEWSSDDLFQAARAENVSRDAIFEAKRTLDLPRARKVIAPNGDVGFVWWVPADWPGLRDEEAASEVDQEAF